MTTDTMVRADGVWRRFGRHDALQGLNLAVPEGSAYALIGANGAGKTTTIKLLMNLLEPIAPDSLMSWGYFNAYLEQKEYMEAYVAEELATQMLKDPQVKAATAISSFSMRDLVTHKSSVYVVIPTDFRPTGLATADQALDSIVGLLEWTTTVVCDNVREHPDLSGTRVLIAS